MSKVSARGTAIACFAKFIPALRACILSVDEFRLEVTKEIEATLSVDNKQASKLFNKARRAAARKNTYPDVQLPQPKHPGRPKSVKVEVVQVQEQPAQEQEVVPEVAEQVELGFSIVLVEDGKVAKTYSYASEKAAKLQLGARKKKGGEWTLIKGAAPEVGSAM